MPPEASIEGLGIMVVAAAGFALLARALKLPAMVSYLAAGLLLGPLSGLLEITDSLQLITELGIVLLLFLVGLELSLDKIRHMGWPALLGGVGQVLITLGAAWLLNRCLGIAPITAFWLAFPLTFSSTVVVVKLLEEKGHFHRPYARLAIGILLVQDLAVLILLTLTSGSSTAGEDGSVLTGILKALGGMGVLVGLVLASSRWLLPHPMKWASRSPDTLFISSLAWCFSVVVGAHALHLSHETGAFLAGIALAQLPYSHDLRRRVHPMMNFFIAVFFVALGAKVDFSSLDLHGLGIVLAWTLFVLLAKPFVVHGLLRLLKQSGETAFLSGITLAQISEFSFVFAALALKAGFLPPESLAWIGLTGLATIAISALAIERNAVVYRAMVRRGWLQAGAEDRFHDPEDEAQHHTLRQHVIVVGVNTLGLELVQHLMARGEKVLVIDSDPRKLQNLPCETLHGSVEFLSVLQDAGLRHAKLLISALQIEDVNNMLAYRCREAGIPCGIHVIDLSLVDNLMDMNTTYLMIPKVDGIKLQTRKLKEMGFLKP